MKITIDVSEFYLEESDLETGLRHFVKDAVLVEIKKSIQEKIDTQLTMQIKADVEKNMYQQMNLFIADFIKVGKIKSSRDSNKQITIEEFITEKFAYDSGWSSPSDMIKKLADTYGREMKSRYDLLFASQLVAKMNEQGLLKKDVAKILLSTP